MRKSKKKMLFTMTALAVTVFAFTACQTTAGKNHPTPTVTGGPAPTQTDVPTMTPKETLTPTPTGTNTPTPTATNTPTPTLTPTPRVIEADFTMVTSVPKEQVTDIAGTMTIADYPVVDGSTATLPLSEAVFMTATGADAETAAQYVVHTKTTNSYKRLYNKEVDLLIVYEPAESIVERMKTEPIAIKPIGLDALVFMANQANTVQSLTMEQLISIYSGGISNWKEVGGADKALLAFQRPAGSGSQTLMQKLVMGEVPLSTGDNVFRYNTMSDILEGMLSYNGEDNTLGYSVFYYANNMYFEKDLKFMAVDGVLPSTQTIYDGSYPLDNAFYAAIRMDEPEDSNAHKIFDWLTGNDGQQLVLDLGYVPVDMPEGAVITNKQTVQTPQTQVQTETALKAGQYFIFFNPQNMVYDFYYGDMKVYNEKWEEIANFYNVTLNYDISGIYESRYLPVGQIRQNEAGEQVANYGVYDLKEGKYSVLPQYRDMVVLDAERCFYAVPASDKEEEWQHYKVIGGTGETLVEKVIMEDWLTIQKCGNGYKELTWDYMNYENGSTTRYFDENLKLKEVFAETEGGLPAPADRDPEVEYYVVGAQGCLLDENGNILIDREKFLAKYGNGTDTYCVLPFYFPNCDTTSGVFDIWYHGAVYIVDKDLNLLYKVDNILTEAQYSQIDFKKEYYALYDTNTWEYCYLRYEGGHVLMQDGTMPADVLYPWNKESYLLYKRTGNKLKVEEYDGKGGCISHELPLQKQDSEIMAGYEGNHIIRVQENLGETVNSPYSYENIVPLYEVTLYYKGEPVCREKGINEYVMEQEDGTLVWVVSNGKTYKTQSESLFGDTYSYPLATYVLLKDGKAVYRLEDAYLMFQGQHAQFFLQGNYILAVGNDGTVLVKALQNSMATD